MIAIKIHEYTVQNYFFTNRQQATASSDDLPKLWRRPRKAEGPVEIL